MRQAAAVLLLAVAAFGAGSARARLVDLDRARRGSQELLYLPSGKYLKVVSLGHAPLVADFVYIWAIQYTRLRAAGPLPVRRARLRQRHRRTRSGAPTRTGSAHSSSPRKPATSMPACGLSTKGLRREPSPGSPYTAGSECHRVGRFAVRPSISTSRRGARCAGVDLRLEAGMTARAGNAETIAQSKTS
jgi:hypothetical protein